MAWLFADENFSLPTVEELRRLGHDVLTLAEGGKAGQALPDEDVLALAHAAGRMLVTLNRKHFIHLHQAQLEHSGIAVCTFDPDFVGLARRIDETITTQAQLIGQLIRINRPPL